MKEYIVALLGIKDHGMGKIEILHEMVPKLSTSADEARGMAVQYFLDEHKDWILRSILTYPKD